MGNGPLANKYLNKNFFSHVFEIVFAFAFIMKKIRGKKFSQENTTKI